MSKEQLDLVLSKFVSRKLMVFLVACGGLFSGSLTSSDWVIVSTAYIGSQAVLDAVKSLKS
jgi:hypothetical protein